MVNRRWRVYRKRRSIRLPNPPMMSARRSRRTVSNTFLDRQLLGTRASQVQHWQDALLNRFAPPGLLINRQLELVHVFGDAGKYLRPITGRATLEIVKLVVSKLQTAVRAALHRAARSNEAVQYKGVRISAENEPVRYVELTTEPFTAEGDHENYFLLTIKEPHDTKISQPITNESFAPDAASIEEIASLERELQYTKEHLQATVEELETTNEELQSTNEEMVAANEELQSTNEELHSVNEELYTVNSEYQQKISDLMQVTNDMKNLQRSSRVRTIFLDMDHRIREFTPAAAEIFNLLPQDIGRPIEHLLYNLSLTTAQLREVTRRVLRDETMVTEAVQLPTGEDFLLRVLPYRTETGVIEGVVLTMTNVSRLKSAERTISQRADRMATLIEIMSQPNHDLQTLLQVALKKATEALGLHMGLISRVNDDICNINIVHAPNNELSAGDVFPLGETYCDISIAATDVIAIHQLADSQFADHAAYQKFGLNTHIGTKVLVNNTCYGALNFSQPAPRQQPFSDQDKEFVSLLGVWVGNMLEMRLVEEALAEAQTNLTTILYVAQLPMLHVGSPSRKIKFVNPAFTRVFGYESEEVVEGSTKILYPSEEDYVAWGQKMRELGPQIANKPLEVEFKRKDGSIFLGRVFRTAQTDKEGIVTGYVGTIFDTSLLTIPARRLVN